MARERAWGEDKVFLMEQGWQREEACWDPKRLPVAEKKEASNTRGR